MEATIITILTVVAAAASAVAAWLKGDRDKAVDEAKDVYRSLKRVREAEQKGDERKKSIEESDMRDKIENTKGAKKSRENGE